MNQPSTCATREPHISGPYGSSSVVPLKCKPSVCIGPSCQVLQTLFSTHIQLALYYYIFCII